MNRKKNKRKFPTPKKERFAFMDIESFILRAPQMLNLFIRLIELIESMNNAI